MARGGRRGWALTIHSSRTRFAGRLNSGVRRSKSSGFLGSRLPPCHWPRCVLSSVSWLALQQLRSPCMARFKHGSVWLSGFGDGGHFRVVYQPSAFASVGWPLTVGRARPGNMTSVCRLVGCCVSSHDRLTIQSSRTGFASRLISGVRQHGRVAQGRISVDSLTAGKRRMT